MQHIFVKPAAQHGSQRTPLARPVSWRFFMRVVSCHRALPFMKLPAAPLKPSVGPPSVTNAAAEHAVVRLMRRCCQKPERTQPRANARGADCPWCHRVCAPVVPRPSCRARAIARRAARPSGAPSPVRSRVPGNARRAGRVVCGPSPNKRSSCGTSPVRSRVPSTARRLPTPGPTHAVARRRCAAFNLAFVFKSVSCGHSPRSSEPAAARLSSVVGPPSAHMAAPEG